MPTSRHTPFLVAMLASIAGFASSLWLDTGLAAILAADCFFVFYLALTIAGVGKLTKDYLQRHAASNDAPALLIFLITLGTVCVAMASLFIAINGAAVPGGLRLALALAAVPLGWCTIHLMAANHYAHLFWQPDVGKDKPRHGLEFPGTKEPEGWDFVYFAFVIGMTAQTSDVQISGQHMRRFNLVHAVISFAFNTILVAAAVNVAVALGK